MVDATPTELAAGDWLPTEFADEKPRVWTVFAAFFTALIGAIGLQSVAVLIVIAWWTAQGVAADKVVQQLPQKLGTVETFILMASCGQLAMVLTILVAARLSPIPWRERLGLLPARSTAKVNLFAMVGSLTPLAIGFVLAGALSWLLPGDPSVQALLEGLTFAEWVLFILFLATVPAVVEEILFRGYIQRRLLQRWRPLSAIGTTSVLFALMHVMPQAVVALLPLSVWLGVVAWRAGSVYPTMLCHAFINGGVNLWRMVVKFGDLSEPVQIMALSVMLLGSLVCMLLAWREMFRGKLASVAEASESAGNLEAVGE